MFFSMFAPVSSYADVYPRVPSVFSAILVFVCADQNVPCPQIQHDFLSADKYKEIAHSLQKKVHCAR